MSRRYVILGGELEEFSSQEDMDRRTSHLITLRAPWWAVPYKVSDGKWGYVKVKAHSREEALVAAENIHASTYRGLRLPSNYGRPTRYTYKLGVREKRKITYDEPFIIQNDRDLESEEKYRALVGENPSYLMAYTQGNLGYGKLSQLHDEMFDLFENEGS